MASGLNIEMSLSVPPHNIQYAGVACPLKKKYFANYILVKENISLQRTADGNIAKHAMRGNNDCY